jgi:hypothetical protein
MSAYSGRKSPLGSQGVPSERRGLIGARSLVVCAVLLSLPLYLPAIDQSEKPWRSTPDLSMGAQDVQLDGHCLRMSATIVDSSLAKLRKKRSASGTEFHRGKNVIDHFPDEVMVELTITDCASPYTVPVGRDILGAMQFAAEWRRGTEERPVGGLYVPRTRSKDSSPESHDTVQVFELSIQSADVPLSDQLVLTVSASDGKKLAQFVAGL